MILNWVIVGLIVAGIVCIAWALVAGVGAHLEGAFIFLSLVAGGGILIAIALLLWAVRWFRNSLPPWL